MERFIKFSKMLLLAVLIVSSAGRLVFDIISGSAESAGAAALSMFSYGTFITLTVGFVLCVIWTLCHFFASLGHKQTEDEHQA